MNLLSICWTAWLGCTNSGLGRTDTGTAPAAACPWVGTWTLDELLCSTFEYQEWFDSYQSATMRISDDGAGGCAVEMTLVGNTCERVEAWHFTLPQDTGETSATGGTDVTVRFDGIQDCEPNQCVMEVDGGECSPGDLQGEETLEIDGTTAGKLRAEGLLEDTASLCPLDIVSEWSLE